MLQSQTSASNIQIWLLAHTQFARSLEMAWEQYCIKFLKDDPDGDKKKLEIEKIIGQTVQESWYNRIEELKKVEENSPNNSFSQISITSDCIGYNIHNIRSEDNKDLELNDVTLWRFSLKELKFAELQIDGIAQLKGLEQNTKDKKQDRKNDNKSKKKKIKKC